MYQTPAVSEPTMAEMRSLAQKHHFNISDEDLEQYRAYMKTYLETYDSLEKLPEPGLTVKFPSLPGYTPKPEDNPYNAWARITDTHGASSGKLAGKKVVIKDNISMAGVPMTVSSQFMMGCVPAYHATVVSRVLDAGAVIKGKAICENMCFSGSSYSSAPAPVLNPFDKERVSGGSSSGNAVLIATEEVDLGIGTDQGGSIRLPSSWCGIVGLKPTFGLVPYTGILPLEGSMDFAGPMSRTVKDCALLLEVLAGYDDGLDPRQPVNLTVPSYTQLLNGKIDQMKIALIQEGFEECDLDVAETVKNAARRLQSLGAVVEEISFPSHVAVSALASTLIAEGTYDTYINGGLTPLNCKGYKDTLIHDFLFNASRAKADALPISMKSVILSGAYVREKYGCHFYAKATNIMRDFVKEYDRLFTKYKVIIMPTIKCTAPKHPSANLTVSGFLHNHLTMTKNTFPYNATGHPALSINSGFSNEGLPIGMMIVGNHFDDSAVLNVAYAFEKIRDGKQE